MNDINFTMYKLAGIIAEYDPFHNGHAWQLQQAKALGAQRVAVAMSCGADPAGRAAPAARKRAGAGCADLRGRPRVRPARPLCLFRGGTLCPGRGAAAGCRRVRRSGVRSRDPRCGASDGSRPGALWRGIPHRPQGPACCRGPQLCGSPAAAVEAVCPGTGLAALLDKPNNNLAVEYCKAILELGASLVPIPLPRQGAGHGQALTETGGQFASASALRTLWQNGGADAAAPYVPAEVLPLYREAFAAGQYTDLAAAQRCQLALLRSRCAGTAPFAQVRGISEGLEHRLEAAVRSSTTHAELLDSLTTVRYPRARMRRLAMDAALGYSADASPALPPYLHLLGAQKDALPLLKLPHCRCPTPLRGWPSRTPPAGRWWMHNCGPVILARCVVKSRSRWGVHFVKKLSF